MERLVSRGIAGSRWAKWHRLPTETKVSWTFAQDWCIVLSQGQSKGMMVPHHVLIFHTSRARKYDDAHCLNAIRTTAGTDAAHVVGNP